MDEEAILLMITTQKGEGGFPVEETKKIPVWAREKSVIRSEFYSALHEGISAKTVLEIRQEDFEMSAHMVCGKKEYASKVIYDGSTYDIVRYYKVGKSMVQITCS